MSQEGAEIEEPTGFVKCPVCGETIKSKGQYGHFSRNHPDLNYREYRDMFTPAKPPERVEEARAPEQLYKGEPDVNSILREILRTHPDVPKRVVEEIMSWAQMSPGGLHPTQVAYLLSSMKGVSSQTANIVAQKYSLALIKAQQEGKIQQVPMIPGLPAQAQQMMFPATPGLTQQQTPTLQFPTTGGPETRAFQFLTPWIPQSGTSATPTTAYLTREEFLRLMEEEREKSKIDRLEERINQIDKSFANTLSSLKDDILKRFEEYRRPDLQYVVEEIPVDKDGKPCPPDKAVTVKRVHRPPTVPTVEREDFLDKLIKLKQSGIIGKEIDENTIRRIIKEERRPEESEEVKALRAQLNDSRKAIDDLKGMIEAKDRQALVEKLNSLENRLNTIATVGGEWRTDEMKVLASSIHELADIIKGKRPLETAKEILVPPGVTPTRPPSEMAGESERGRVIRELSKHGLVTRIVER